MPHAARTLVLALCATAASTVLAGCGGDDPLGERGGDAPVKVSDDTTTAQLTAAAVERALPSVVAVSVTRGGETLTGTGTVLSRGYVVTDAALVGASATAVPKKQTSASPTPRPSGSPQPTTPRATTPTGTTPSTTATPRATTPTASSPPATTTPVDTPSPTPRPAPKLPPPATITVREASGAEHAATLEGSDALSGLAVLRVGELASVPVAKAGEAPQLGEQVAGVAYLSARRPAVRPGTLVTVGRAVRKDREVEVGLMESTATLGGQGVGGPLVDGRGQVVGIATAALDPVIPGTVVALPYASAMRIARALADKGRVRRAYLGIDTVGLTPDRAEELQLSTASGVIIRTIVAGSPASFSTLKAATGMVRIGGRLIPTGSDAITAIDGRPVKEPEDLDAELARKQPGDRVALQVVRGTRGLVVHVTLGER